MNAAIGFPEGLAEPKCADSANFVAYPQESVLRIDPKLPLSGYRSTGNEDQTRFAILRRNPCRNHALGLMAHGESKSSIMQRFEVSFCSWIYGAVPDAYSVHEGTRIECGLSIAQIHSLACTLI
jgi:hypothetical protein